MLRRWIVPTFACTLLALGCSIPTVRGDMVVPFFGIDAGAGPGPKTPLTNTYAAETAFATMTGIGPSPSIDFGPGPVSPSFKSPQIQMLTSDLDVQAPTGYQFGITSQSYDQYLGYNVGGDKQHFEVAPTLGTSPATLTFISTTPFDAFGFYLTGFGNVQSTSMSVEFTDASGRVSAPMSVKGSPDGGALFFGVFDPGASIMQFEIQVKSSVPTERDVFGISDIRFATVPEPASVVLLVVGGLAALGTWRARRG